LLGAVSGACDGILLGCLLAPKAEGMEGLGQFVAMLSACAFGGAVFGGLAAVTVGLLLKRRDD